MKPHYKLIDLSDPTLNLELEDECLREMLVNAKGHAKNTGKPLQIKTIEGDLIIYEISDEGQLTTDISNKICAGCGEIPSDRNCGLNEDDPHNLKAI